LRLINKEGKLVDIDGRLIDEFGRFINEKGEYVDKNGNLVDENGDYVTDFQPFTDDDGNPILIDEEKKEAKNETVEQPRDVDTSTVEQTTDSPQ
jgi:flagellar basal body rod protein FlgG